MDEPERVPAHPAPKRFTEDVIAQIVKGTRREGVEIEATSAQWASLEHVLRRHDELCAYWAGFLGKTQTEQLNDVAKKAAALWKALEKSLDAGTSRIIADKVGLGPEGGLEATIEFAKVLSRLSEMEIRSPKSEKSTKANWQDRLAYDEAKMQIWIDQWWTKNTAEKMELSEGEVTPYIYFLNQVFRPFPNIRAGASRTAVLDRRRKHREGQKREQEVWEALQRAGRKLQKLKRDQEA